MTMDTQLSSSSRSNGTGPRTPVGRLLLLLSTPRLRATAVVMTCGFALLGLSGILSLDSSVSDKAASITCGGGLLLAWMAVFMCLAINCQLTETSHDDWDERRPSLRYCIWQKLKYAELFVQDFSPAFVVTKVGYHGKKRVVEIVEHAHAPPPQHLGASSPEDYGRIPAHSLASSCGCCLGEFDDADGVILLPCYHVFCDECILSWAMSSALGSHSCPTCRASFVKDPVCPAAL